MRENTMFEPVAEAERTDLAKELYREPLAAAAQEGNTVRLGTLATMGCHDNALDLSPQQKAEIERGASALAGAGYELSLDAQAIAHLQPAIQAVTDGFSRVEIVATLPELILREVHHEEARRILSIALEHPAVRAHMARLYQHHAETFFHCIRVAEAAVEISDLMLLDYDDEQLVALATGALLHDIGKCGVPLGILDKPDKPTDAERAALEQHPIIGYQLLANTGLAVPQGIVGAHHIHQPQGYGVDPDGETIGFMSEIVAAVDKRDALASRRAYKNPLPPNEATTLLQQGLTARETIKDMAVAMIRRNSS